MSFSFTHTLSITCHQAQALVLSLCFSVQQQSTAVLLRDSVSLAYKRHTVLLLDGCVLNLF